MDDVISKVFGRKGCVVLATILIAVVLIGEVIVITSDRTSYGADVVFSNGSAEYSVSISYLWMSGMTNSLIRRKAFATISTRPIWLSKFLWHFRTAGSMLLQNVIHQGYCHFWRKRSLIPLDTGSS